MNKENEILLAIYIDRILTISDIVEKSNIKTEFEILVVDKDIFDEDQILHILSKLYKRHKINIRPHITDIRLIGFDIYEDQDTLTYISID